MRKTVLMIAAALTTSGCSTPGEQDYRQRWHQQKTLQRQSTPRYKHEQYHKRLKEHSHHCYPAMGEKGGC